MPKTIYIHFNNDYTGSTRVLSGIIKEQSSYDCIEVITNEVSKGFLSNLGVPTKHFDYKAPSNKYLRVLYWVLIQIRLFFFILWNYKNQPCTFYINTILPVGAAVAGKLLKQHVIVHIHETAMRPFILQKIWCWIIQRTASRIIYVSQFSRKAFNITHACQEVVYNRLNKTFLQQIKPTSYRTILMISSLNKHKGYQQFIQLAQALPAYDFELVLGASMGSIRQQIDLNSLPPNLAIYNSQKNIHPFYQRAAILLNLSHPQKWIESFGMTILEAQAYGIPCIVPPIGGPVELIEDGYNGMHCSSLSLPSLKEKIELLMSQEKRYQQMCNNAQAFFHSFCVKNGIFPKNSIIPNKNKPQTTPIQGIEL